MRQLIPALLLLTLLVPAAAAVEVPVTRAQFVAALWSWAGALPAAGTQPFSDVPEGHWAYDEILEASVSHSYVKYEGGERWS